MDTAEESLAINDGTSRTLMFFFILTRLGLV